MDYGLYVTKNCLHAGRKKRISKSNEIYVLHLGNDGNTHAPGSGTVPEMFQEESPGKTAPRL